MDTVRCSPEHGLPVVLMNCSTCGYSMRLAHDWAYQHSILDMGVAHVASPLSQGATGS